MSDANVDEAVRLHIGGEEPMSGWKILNALPGPDVDIVANATNLDMFAAASVDVVYASHILEHLKGGELRQCLSEIHRVLKPGCRLLGGVPDLEILCRMWLENREVSDTLYVGAMIFGGHINEYDIHHIGFDTNIMTAMLVQAGFAKVYRVPAFNIFRDQTTHAFKNECISLNFIAEKAP